jgi:hypothetical protein
VDHDFDVRLVSLAFLAVPAGPGRCSPFKYVCLSEFTDHQLPVTS